MGDDRTFVSYSRADSQFAVKLASDLRAKGASIWLDQLDIAPGARWDSAIEDALRRSARVIVLLSPTATASQNVLDEVSFALDEGKAIVPVLVEACSVPMRLRRLQHVDFTPGYEAALGRLLVTLGVAPTSVSPAATPPPEPSPGVPPPASATPEPPLRDPAIPSTGPASGQRTILFAGVAAAVVVVAVLAVWLSSRSDDVTDSPAKAVVSSAPAGTTAPDDTTAPPTASAPASTGTEASPASLAPVITADDPGLKTLLGTTRQMERLDKLTQSDLEQLAEAQSLACRGNPTVACLSTASGYVDSLLTKVCGRGLGARPSDETLAVFYDSKLSQCRQAYMNILETLMNLNSGEPIRSLKVG